MAADRRKLELAVIGADELVTRPGYERRADAFAQLGAHRNVLQIRVGAAQTSGLRNRQIKGGVQARVFVDQLRVAFPRRGVFSLVTSRHCEMRSIIGWCARSLSSSVAAVLKPVLPC